MPADLLLGRLFIPPAGPLFNGGGGLFAVQDDSRCMEEGDSNVLIISGLAELFVIRKPVIH